MTHSLSLLGISPELAAAPGVVAAFSDQATIARALAVEVALARAEARCGVIPADAVAVIERAADASLYDIDAIATGALRAGVLTVPLVKALTEQVERIDGKAAGFVHFGATSQDIADTALVLQLGEALAVIRADAEALAGSLETLALRHAAAPMLGRTLMQPGPPVTFGLKAAQWLAGLARAVDRLDTASCAALVVQFGGAVGSLASLGGKGLDVLVALGEELGLAVPEAPWHTQQDRMVALGSALAILTGVLGKMARDVSLMSQAEIGEIAEPGGNGRGGSSTMPHKRNPVAAIVTLACAGRVPGLLATLTATLVQEHERGVGSWQAEASALADLALCASGALGAMKEAIAGLHVDEMAMARQIARMKGLVFSEKLMLTLAPKLGRAEAHHLAEELVRKAVAEGSELKDVAAADPVVARELAADEIASLFEPARYLGSTPQFIERLIASSRALMTPKGQRP